MHSRGPAARLVRSGALLWFVSVLVLLLAPSAAGQGIAPRQTRGVGIFGVGTVGNTTVARNAQYLGTGQFGRASATPSTGNFSPGSPAAPALGGRTRGGRQLWSDVPAGRSAFVVPPIAGSFAHSVAMPVPSGTHLFTDGGGVPAVARSARNASLFHRMELTLQLGNSYRAQQPPHGRRIRDGLSQETLDHAPASDRYLHASARRRSYSTIMAEQIAARHARAVAEGWEHFAQGEYRSAIRSFESGEVADRKDPEATLGIVCSAVADEAYELAFTVLARMLSSQEGVFELDVDIRARHKDPEAMTALITGIGRYARERPESAQLAALSVTLLWFSGQRSEALRNADRIHEEHRTSPYASIAARMRGLPVGAAEESLSRNAPAAARPAYPGGGL